MSKTVMLGSFYPEDLNLNGDQANLLVLAKRLEWRGVNAVIVPLTGSSNLEKVDLVLLGHGSMAAWNSILKTDPELITKSIDYMNANRPLLAIGSGYVKVLDELGESYSSKEHRSEFVDVDGVVGYVNSSADVDLIQFRNSSVLTLLHGPLLAKNPKLADEIIRSNEWADISMRSSELDQVDELAAISRRTAFEH